MIKQEVAKLIAVAVALLVVILLTTEREGDDWRFGGYMLLAYLAVSLVIIGWQRTRERD